MNKEAKIYKHSYQNLFSIRYILTWPLFFILWLLAKLPHKVNIKIGKFLGKLLYPLVSKYKYIIKTNLSLCFPDKSEQEINILTKKSFESLTIGALETIMAWFGTKKQLTILQKKVVINNEEIIKQAYASNKPVLLVSPHCASAELVGKIFVQRYNYTPVFRHMNNPVANYLMQKGRLNIYKDHLLKANTRTIINYLKTKKPVLILPDQDFGKKRSVFVPFFGVPAATSTALSKYKKMTDCIILGIGYHKDYISNKYIIDISKLDITGHDLEHDATELNKQLENIIIKDIPMYFWIARRFKSRPEGMPKIYNIKKRKKKK